MFEKQGKFYADWRDRKGVRRTKILHFRPSRHSVRRRTKGSSPPKTQGTGTTLAQILCARDTKSHRAIQRHETITAKAIIAQAGSQPKDLSTARVLRHCLRMGTPLRARHKVTHYTTLRRSPFAGCGREHGAPKLDRYVPRLTGVRPRNVTATREQIDTLIQSARPAMRLWLLFCTDLGIRSGTAITLGPDHYRADNQSLSFVTKKSTPNPTTHHRRHRRHAADLRPRQPPAIRHPTPRQRNRQARAPSMKNDAVNIFNLRQEFKALRIANGIHKRIVPHDFAAPPPSICYGSPAKSQQCKAYLDTAPCNQPSGISITI